MSSSNHYLLSLVTVLLISSLQAATTQKTTRYEAENATLGGGNIASWGAGYSGTGFVINPNSSGDYVQWTVSAEAAGSVELKFGYTLGGTADRPMQIRVNGVLVATSHSFPPTGGWDKTYQECAPLTVSLNAGNNTIRATAIGLGPQMDYAQIKEILPLSGQIMTVYNGANLTGTSVNIPATHVVYSGTSIPGSLDNLISSFVLTEGYMAVVADQADGLQPSKVYIAADGPLVVNTLPSNLENAISFIRVIPWKNDTLKKGFCGGNEPYRTYFDHSWYYSWTQGVDRGLRAYGAEFTPMCWDEKYVQFDKFLAQDNATHLLSFNEPDGVNQANMPDVVAAVALHKELQKAGLRLGSPACEEQNAFTSTSWLNRFMVEANAQGVRVDYINVHWYDYGNVTGPTPDSDPVAAANRQKAYLSNVYARHRKPIWITEFNVNPTRPRSVHDSFLQEIMPYLDDIGYVERYAYYQWPATVGTTMYFVEPSDNSLTTTGQIYNDHQSSVAYVSGDLPTTWQSSDVGTTNEGASIYNGNYTISGSGTGIAGTADGCRYVYQTVSGDSTITALVRGQIWRNNETTAGVMIRKDLTAGSPRASMALSWSNGARFRTRSAAGGSTTTATQAGIPKYPYWVRLVRKDNIFTGYTSPDGISWTQVGTPTTIAMGTDVYVGLAVTSNSDGNFNDAIFKNVSVTQTLGQSLYIDWTRNPFTGSFSNTAQAGNSDGDILNNLQEFAFGTDPTSPMISALSFTTGTNLELGIPALMKLPVSGQPDAYHAVFSRRKNHTEAGLNYVVEFSADLSRWTASSAGLTVRSENGAGTFEAVSVPFPSTVPVQSGGANVPPKFFRVGLTQQ